LIVGSRTSSSRLGVWRRHSIQKLQERTKPTNPHKARRPAAMLDGWQSYQSYVVQCRYKFRNAVLWCPSWALSDVLQPSAHRSFTGNQLRRIRSALRLFAQRIKLSCIPPPPETSSEILSLRFRAHWASEGRTGGNLCSSDTTPLTFFFVQ
jgi:hypothetical protein